MKSQNNDSQARFTKLLEEYSSEYRYFVVTFLNGGTFIGTHSFKKVNETARQR